MGVETSGKNVCSRPCQIGLVMSLSQLHVRQMWYSCPEGFVLQTSLKADTHHAAGVCRHVKLHRMLSATAAAARQHSLVVADTPVTAEDMHGRVEARGCRSSRAISSQTPNGKQFRAPDVRRPAVDDRPFEV